MNPTLLLLIPIVPLIAAVLAGVFGGPTGIDSPAALAIIDLVTGFYAVFSAACWVEAYVTLSGERGYGGGLAEIFS